MSDCVPIHLDNFIIEMRIKGKLSILNPLISTSKVSILHTCGFVVLFWDKSSVG